MDYGVCAVCGESILAMSSFVNTGPSDMNDPGKAPYERWVPVDEDIHGWTPFILKHPACYASERGVQALVRLVDASDRRWRRRLQHP
jgi:hypothetical protein